MATKIKGIYTKSFKYISQIFVGKEREMEIGYPTDVKHVAHIGWDGNSGPAPSWMTEYKTAPRFSTTTIGNGIDPNSINFSPWSSQDFDQLSGNSYNNISTSTSELTKKSKRKKKKQNSSPTSSSRSLAFNKSKANL